MSEGNTCSEFGCTFMATEECADCGPDKKILYNPQTQAWTCKKLSISNLISHPLS